MRKRLIGTCMIVILLCSIYGYAQIADNTIFSGSKSKEEDMNVDEITGSLSFDFEETEYEYSDENCNISLRYPQMTGSNDAEKEKRINHLIEEDIKKVSEWATPDKYGRKYDLGVTWYKIKYADEKMISIVYSGWAGRLQPGSGLPATMMATTVDCEKETVLELQDVVSDFDGLCRLLLEDRFENITAWDGEPGQYKISESYWLGGADALLRDLKGSDYDMEWYIGKDYFIIVDLTGKYYNEYSIEVNQVENILQEDFLKFTVYSHKR